MSRLPWMVGISTVVVAGAVLYLAITPYWRVDYVAQGVVGSLAISPAGAHYGSFVDHDGILYVALLYSLNFEGAYDRDSIGEPASGRDFSFDGHELAVDQQDRLHIAYHDGPSRSIIYRRRTGTQWGRHRTGPQWDAAEVVESFMPSPDYPFGHKRARVCIAVTSDGDPWIVYNKGTELRVRRKVGTVWRPIVTIDPNYDRSRKCSIAIDRTGTAHLAYYKGRGYGVPGYEPDDQMYASSTNGISWNVQKVDGPESVGEWSSLVVDAANQPHIAYFDASAADLKYANRYEGLWSPITVEWRGNVGRGLDMAVDAADRYHMSFFWDGGPECHEVDEERPCNQLFYRTAPMTASTEPELVDEWHFGVAYDWTSVAVDCRSRVTILFRKGSGIRVAKRLTLFSGLVYWLYKEIFDFSNPSGRYSAYYSCRPVGRD